MVDLMRWVEVGNYLVTVSCTELSSLTPLEAELPFVRSRWVGSWEYICA